MKREAITEYLDSLLERGIPSVDCIIYKGHQQIYRHMNGTVDGGRSKRIQGDERYLMFSMTKVMTMTAVMQLVEQGKIDLEEEVSRYLPAYGKLTVERNGRVETLSAPLKIKHLLSMQSGLDYDLERPGILRVLKEKGAMASTRELVDSFVETPLKFVPGEHFMYSLSHDVAAAVVEVVSGMRFGDWMKEKIWEPLQMKDTFFAAPVNENTERLATQFICEENGAIVPMEPTCNYQLSEKYESGGAGLISCTEDYAALADTLACGGISKEGRRILKPESIALMKKNLLGKASLKDLAENMGRTGYGYGCGVQVLMHPELIQAKAPAGVFGWDGAAGSCIIMDTESELSLVYVQHVRNCGMAYGEIHPRLRDLMYL
ncbi:MAG: beta-lactamase family protein [Roseburia sp.]|nr:beta-lactamase family protein [Roseburia sp.]